jgi:YD repeat-containing protein
MTTHYTDGNNNVTSYEYDSRRRVTKKILPDIVGEHTEIVYSYEDTFNKLNEKQDSIYD